MRSLVFAAPGKLTTPTGGFVYDRRIVVGLRALGWRIETVDLGDGFPFPSPAARAQARARLAALPAGEKIVIDGLALGALPEAAKQQRAHLIALVHHPLALESGLSSSDAAELRVSEAEALACARRVIVTSRFTAGLLVSDYGVPAERVAPDHAGLVGNLGVAQAGLQLADVLERATPGQVVVVLELADGADAAVLRTTDALPVAQAARREARSRNAPTA